MPNERNCYCRVREDGTAGGYDDALPAGFCGWCEVCGAPGHTQHYPGARPYTGAWCDRCVGRIGRWGSLPRAAALAVLLGAPLLLMRACGG